MKIFCTAIRTPTVVGGILSHNRFDSYWRWSYGGVVFCISPTRLPSADLILIELG